MQGTFKRENPLEKRIKLSERLREKHPDHVPIILEVYHGSKVILTRTKFICPGEVTMAFFLKDVRGHIKNLRPEQAIFLFCGPKNNILVPMSTQLANAYQKYKDQDGFMYMVITLENTFGMWSNIADELFDNLLYSSSNAARKTGVSKLNINYF